MTKDRTLLPCPFCGRSDTTKFWLSSEMHADCENDAGNDDSVAVVCDAATPNGPGGCGASSGFAATYDEAADRWNQRRAAEPRGDPTKRCQHDLLKPASTIVVTDTGGRCTVCLESWNLVRAENRGGDV